MTELAVKTQWGEIAISQCNFFQPEVSIQSIASLCICTIRDSQSSHVHCKTEQALCHNLSIQTSNSINLDSLSGMHAQVFYFNILQYLSTESITELYLVITQHGYVMGSVE